MGNTKRLNHSVSFNLLHVGMCGIAGIINFDNRAVQSDEVKQITDRMLHRGPDDEGFFIDGRIGLGMRRLSIIDVRGGHQPISNEDETVWVVMNGEIYNYVELREELKARGHTFRTGSDTEVLVHGYEEKGVDFVHDLNGMFAFALYDKKRGGIWMVRDRLGIKPLYYVQKNGRFLFSSDLNTFPKELRNQINQDALLLYFGHGYVPTPYTIWKGIKKLPPAHWMWVAEGEIKIQEYWKVQNFQTADIGVEEARKRLDELLYDSIRLQLRSDVPLAMMLSGGVDSSAIVAIASRSIEFPVNTFTINFLGKDGEDIKYARAVASQYHTHHREIAVSPEDLLRGFNEVLKFLDEPVFDSAIVPTYLIAKAAREQGVKVMLSGAGGDELFGGYRRHFRPRLASPAWVAEHFSDLLRKPVGALWAMVQPHRGWRAQDPGIAYLSGIFGADLGFYRNVLDAEVFKRFTEMLAQVTVPLHQGQSLTNKGLSLMRQRGYHYERMHFDLTHYLVDNILSLTDKATMATSVEGRVPILDHRLVEFAFSLPESVNIGGGQSKGLFKNALQQYLPADLLHRSKEGFNAPIASWMGQNFYSRIVEELKNHLMLPLQDILDQDKLEEYLKNIPRQPFLANTLYSLYVLNRWLQYHV